MLLRRPGDLAALVRDARKRAGLTQGELAERVGTSRQWISLVETGKTTVEFDLVFGALRALGFGLSIEPWDSTPPRAGAGMREVEQPADVASPRTRLTRHGAPLGTQRTRRRPTGRTQEP